jgi:hypothetical protein
MQSHPPMLIQGHGGMTSQPFRGFYTTGKQYAEAAFIAESQRKVICANLWHLAIEMIMKGGIARQYQLDTVDDMDCMLQRIKGAYGHPLNKLWGDFKKYYPKEDLEEFNNVIEQLDPWVSIKYPKVQEEQIRITRAGQEVLFRMSTNFQTTEVRFFEIEALEVERLIDKLKSILQPFSDPF